MNRINLVAEIGINHNGDIVNVLTMIELAKAAGFDYVKFQKRTPEICVPKNQKNKKKKVHVSNNILSPFLFL